MFAVNGGRNLTHMKRLSGVETALANFFASGPLLLGEKLGPILWQLPATVAFDEPLLTAFFELLPVSTDDAATLAAQHDDKVSPARASTKAPGALPIRYALEVSHDSFRGQRPRRLLERHGVSLVLGDSAGRWPMIDEATSDLTYVRLHGHTTLYTSGYAPASLERWAERCLARAGQGQDVFVYFDNDVHGHAPHNALPLQARIAGRPVPRRSSVSSVRRGWSGGAG